MNRTCFLHILAIFMLSQAAFDATAQNKKPLNEYIEKAKKEEDLKDKRIMDLGHSVAVSTASLYGPLGACGMVYNPFAAVTAISMATLIGAYANVELHNYIARAPTGFRESLEKLDKLIDHEKSVIIGGKEYMLAKDFNKIYHTSYVPMNADQRLSKETINFMTENIISGSKHQYEIYLMPDHKNLVPVFDAITQALQSEKNNIAFIAIRPTPVLTNARKQILPRIVIVLKESTDLKHSKEIAENILRTVYNTLETIPGTNTWGGWPRYSDKVKFGYAVGKMLSTKDIKDYPIFVGVGNTDFKQQYPNLFERRKFLGIVRNGDMAYPLNTPESDKIGTVILGK